MNTPETLVKKIVQEQGTIQDVFLTACGGSLVDLYPGYYFINAESETMHAHWLTAKEMVVSPSKFLKKGALVILCSHGGNTPETVNAAKFAKERGAAIITMTHNPESVCAQEDMNPIVYDWSDETDEKERPQGLVMRILNELLKVQETGYKKYDAILDGLEKADGIVRAAVKKVQNRTWLFAEKYAQEPFLYIMGSGASYSQAYGFSICSLQEMQWMDCCYLHSGEYFHGPFECTDKDHLYILLMGTGKARAMDERALTFLEKYGEKYEVIDAEELGINTIDESVNEYFCPMLFYAMSVAYRTGLQDKRRHPLDMRRYMGVVEY
ncbi:SIS domain-containing protein [[Ruminococcus] gnavus]|uniref:SIS domain-containing protein n=1 Tax=Mediterraneibacter gnavus TaxID=33038 RepID=A0AAJ1GCX2_MEDGN|nr:SIS domain-containing protein [Mediterraneibacter gnavus]MCZ0689856.1 SIS domain-containing protein [Mediterraneibacter gnavus]